MKVLAIIDMQKDFIDGVLGTKEAVSIVPRVAARLKKAREDGEPSSSRAIRIMRSICPHRKAGIFRSRTA